jgi:hypothetical protein
MSIHLRRISVIYSTRSLRLLHKAVLVTCHHRSRIIVIPAQTSIGSLPAEISGGEALAPGAVDCCSTGSYAYSGNRCARGGQDQHTFSRVGEKRKLRNDRWKRVATAGANGKRTTSGPLHLRARAIIRFLRSVQDSRMCGLESGRLSPWLAPTASVRFRAIDSG